MTLKEKLAKEYLDDTGEQGNSAHFKAYLTGFEKAKSMADSYMREDTYFICRKGSPCAHDFPICDIIHDIADLGEEEVE